MALPTARKGTFFAKAGNTNNEMYIYDQIGEDRYGGGITASSVAEEIREFTNTSLPLDIYINSPGGSVFEGIAILNQLKRYAGRKNVHIDGIAASIASVIAMAGDTISIAENALMMVHKAWGGTIGSDEDMRKYADTLTSIDTIILDTYTTRSGGDRAAIKAKVDAETWLTAKEALEMGLVTEISESKTVNASFDLLGKFKNVPKQLCATGAKNDPRVALAAMDMVVMGIKPKKVA